MLHCDRIDLSGGMGIYVAKSNNSEECLICHYCFFNEFKLQNSVYNGCHDLTVLC